MPSIPLSHETPRSPSFPLRAPKYAVLSCKIASYRVGEALYTSGELHGHQKLQIYPKEKKGPVAS